MNRVIIDYYDCVWVKYSFGWQRLNDTERVHTIAQLNGSFGPLSWIAKGRSVTLDDIQTDLLNYNKRKDDEPNS